MAGVKNGLSIRWLIKFLEQVKRNDSIPRCPAEQQWAGNPRKTAFSGPDWKGKEAGFAKLNGPGEGCLVVVGAEEPRRGLDLIHHVLVFLVFPRRDSQKFLLALLQVSDPLVREAALE